MANVITPFLTEVLDCVCAQFTTDGNPVCECCQVASVPPPMTHCDCECTIGQGWAWVGLENASWDQDAVARCPIGVWQASFTAGVYRCISDHEGNCAEATQDAGMVAQDIDSLTQALLCCSAFEGSNWQLGDISIIGPSGGCVGVTVSFTVQFLRFRS